MNEKMSRGSSAGLGTIDAQGRNFRMKYVAQHVAALEKWCSNPISTCQHVGKIFIFYFPVLRTMLETCWQDVATCDSN